MLLRPNKHDIRQIQSLVRLGANHFDIASVLGITEDRLKKWETRNPKVAEILKPKPRPEFTLNHPEYAPMVEEAFTCGGKRFYRFKEEYRQSTGRYKYYYAALREVDLRADLNTLKEYISAFKNILDGGKNGKQISLEALWKLIFNLESRINLAFEPAGVKNLAAIAYFDETEDLTSYDAEYGKQKVKLWEDHGIHDFFLTRPIGELLGLNSTLDESFLTYLKTAEQILTDLNSGLRTLSEEK